MKFAVMLVALIGSGLISSCSRDQNGTMLVEKIKVSKLNILGGGCEGPFYELTDGKLVSSVASGTGSFSHEATIRGDGSNAIIEFGTGPLAFVWKLTLASDHPNVLTLESHLSRPSTPSEQAFFKKSVGYQPEQINKFWNNLKGFTICPR